MTDAARPRPGLFATGREYGRLRAGRLRPWEEAQREQAAAAVTAVEAARRDVGFYRHRFADVDLAAGLADLPLVGKSELRSQPEDDLLACPQPPNARTLTTSGTTGEPFRVHYGPYAAWFQGILLLRMWRARNLAPWHRVAVVNLIPDTRARRTMLGRLAQRWAIQVQPGDARASAALVTARVDVLLGHAHMLLELPRPRRPLRAINTAGGTLLAEDRAALVERFGVNPLDTYGTAEAGQIAWQCAEADLYHVNHEAVVLEILDQGGDAVAPGQTGEVVLTTLWNPLMPFVRYRQGDAAAWADRPCRCGSTRPALIHVTGRVFSWLIDSAGRRVAPQPLALGQVLGAGILSTVQRYRVTQLADRRVTVEIVPRQTWGPDMVARLEQAYRQRLGDVGIDVRLVAQIHTPASEKFEIFRSAATPDG